MSDGAPVSDGPRPVVFLDVDGPLIPFGGRDHPRYGAPDPRHPLADRLDPGHGRRLAALPADLVWATTWGEDANDVVCPRLGLPRLPVVPEAAEEPPARVHWKLPALVEWAAGRPFAWVDDEIGPADRDWVEGLALADVLLHRVDPARGLGPADYRALGEWLAQSR